MRYLNEKDLLTVGLNWDDTIDAIEDAVVCIEKKDFAQPVKPYLRYRDPINRIIAMPAFVGGTVNLAGIKWIAGFPGNIDNGIPRAHAVVILNNQDRHVAQRSYEPVSDGREIRDLIIVENNLACVIIVRVSVKNKCVRLRRNLACPF